MTESTLHWLIAVPACLGFGSLQGVLCSGQRWRRRLAAAIGTLALVVPFSIEQGSVLRAGVALYLLWAWVKVLGLYRDRRARSWQFRAVQMLVLHDLGRDGHGVKGRRHELRLGLAGGGALALLLAFAGLHFALFGASGLPEPWRWLARHAGGLVFAYLGVEGALRCFEVIYRALGLSPPVLHDHPILSRSVGEFWGRRWNRIVGAWLFATFYRPLALAGRRRMGAAAAFVASAALHLYFTWAAVGLSWGLCMAAFFLVQIPVVLLEERWAQRRWPAPLQRLWTFSLMALTSPLFIEPLLVIVRGGFDGG